VQPQDITYAKTISAAMQDKRNAMDQAADNTSVGSPESNSPNRSWQGHIGNTPHTVRILLEALEICGPKKKSRTTWTRIRRVYLQNPQAAVIETHNRDIKITLANKEQAQDLVRSCCYAMGVQPPDMGPPKVAPPLLRCLHIGGYGFGLTKQAWYDLIFTSTGIAFGSSTSSGRGAELALDDIRDVTIGGPGRYQTGGGYVGGGIGMLGAAEGMAIAGLLNALTRKTRVKTTIAVLAARGEAFLVNETYTPDQIRPLISEFFVALRSFQERPTMTVAHDSLVAEFEGLAAMRASGLLTEQEFIAAKARLLGWEKDPPNR
jgi:hypothetical protein